MQVNFPQNTQEYLKDYSNFIDEAKKESTVSVVLHTAFLLKLFIYLFCLYYLLIIRCLKSHLAKDRKCTVGVLKIVLEVSQQTSPLCFTHSKYNKDASNAHYPLSYFTVSMPQFLLLL